VPGPDFVAPEADEVTKRQLCVWSHTIRLRDGANAEESLFMWNYLTKHVEPVAAIPLGETDNTPIHVSDSWIRKVRAVKPKIHVMGALDLNTT
jgi:hypothetical protein